MSVSFFIAKRLYKTRDEVGHISSLGVRIASIGVMIGLAVMIISVAIVFGFKKEIKNKVTGFGSDIQIVNSDASESSESYPIIASNTFLNSLKSCEGVKHVQKVTQKMGVFKVQHDFKGVLLNGVGTDFDASFIKAHLISGSMPIFSKPDSENEIVISNVIAKDLGLAVGDKVFSYFFDKEIKVRRFVVKGIYETNLAQFDESVVYTNRNTINRLNGWSGNDCSIIEITVNNYSENEDVADKIACLTPTKPDTNGCFYAVYSIGELYSSIFDWLNLLDLNIWVILALMTCVCCFTVVSGLLILILEKISTIGLLKAIGASNSIIRRIYMYYGVFLVGRGILWGNIIGLSLCYLQYKFHIFSLDASSYYVDFVPISFEWPLIVLLNISIVLVCSIILLLPTAIVSHLNLVKTLKFD